MVFDHDIWRSLIAFLKLIEIAEYNTFQIRVWRHLEFIPHICISWLLVLILHLKPARGLLAPSATLAALKARAVISFMATNSLVT